MRVKQHLDPEKLQESIKRIEGSNTPPKNMAELYKRVAKDMGVAPGVVMGRIKDYGVQVVTQPGRRQGREKASATVGGLDFGEFQNRGIVVGDITDLMTSIHKDAEANAKIRAAWSAIRRKTGHTKPE